MEAYEEKDVKRDSFEEVDRILAIVEELKKNLDKKESSYRILITILFCMIIGVVGGTIVYSRFQEGINKESDFLAIATMFGALLSCIPVIYTIVIEQKIKREFEYTRDQAVEVIREIVPSLSRSEQWSALRRFELRLRLSKLGISTAAIFNREFDLS